MYDNIRFCPHTGKCWSTEIRILAYFAQWNILTVLLLLIFLTETNTENSTDKA